MDESSPKKPVVPAEAETCEVTETNLEEIVRLQREHIQNMTQAEHVSDAVARFAGSQTFILIHLAWFIVWILMNLGLMPGVKIFDPFPFNLLTMVVSLEAILLTSFVMITQNRMGREADKRAHLDLQVNLLAEQELTTMLKMLTALCERMEVAVPAHEERVAQLLKETDIHELASALDHELAEKAASATESAPAPRTPSPHRS